MENSIIMSSSSGWLLESWQRSVSAGLSNEKSSEHVRLNKTTLSELKYCSTQLIKAIDIVGYPLFEHVYQGKNSRLILANANGVIIASWGQMTFNERLHNIALEAGVCWQENLKGTNAIGTAMIENRTISVIGDQHFFKQHHFISCTATPILSCTGELLGVLDITSEQAVHGQDTIALLHNMVQLVENWLLNNTKNSSVRLEFAKSEALLNTGWQGVLIADQEGIVIAHNQQANRLLNLDRIVGVSIDSLLKNSDFIENNIYRASITEKHNHLGTTHVNKSPKPTLYLHFGDKSMDRVWTQSSKVIDKGINLLVLGETGSGKGELVKALHSHSLRYDKPLISVNCGAIASDLIESELFGYVAGAFTGANQKGGLGKVRAADGGILFLDEIADMPLDSQCRLLTVLQDNEVTPVGSNQAIAVNVRVVAATCKDLPELVERGEFRQDLYYRLNGLIVKLPPLRSRQDKVGLIRHIHGKYADVNQQTLSTALLAFLTGYHWPGNVRELDSALKVAVVLSDGAKELHTSHLPEYLFNQAFHSSVAANVDLNECTLSDHADAQLLKVYADQGKNITNTAIKLGISRQTIYRKLKRLGYK